MRRLLCLAILLPAVGCAWGGDPHERPGTWQPVGSNDANLRAMIADPQDLVTGVADGRADGQVVANAVGRYRLGKTYQLPDASISKVSPISISTGGQASAASTQ